MDNITFKNLTEYKTWIKDIMGLDIPDPVIEATYAVILIVGDDGGSLVAGHITKMAKDAENDETLNTFDDFKAYAERYGVADQFDEEVRMLIDLIKTLDDIKKLRRNLVKSTLEAYYAMANETGEIEQLVSELRYEARLALDNFNK